MNDGKDEIIYKEIVKEKDCMIDSYTKLIDTIINNNYKNYELDVKRDRNRTIITIVSILVFGFIFFTLLCYVLVHK